MKVPEEVQNLLDKRMDLAIELASVSSELDNWLIENGADLSDSDIKDSTISGCMIFAEPGSAKRNVEDYIRNKM